MIPEEFIRYAFEELVERIKRLLHGKFGPDVLINLTKHNAAAITCGPVRINGSIKARALYTEKSFSRKPSGR